MKPIKLKWIKMSALLCCTVLFFLCGFQSPFTNSIPVSTLAASDKQSVSSTVSSEVSSLSSSAVSSSISSQVSSTPVSSAPIAQKVGVPVVQVKAKVAAKKDLADDPDNKISVSQSSKPAPSQPPVSIASSAASSVASSVASSIASSIASSSSSLKGWKTENGNLVYYRNDSLLKGWDTLDGTYYGKKYHFDEDTGAVKTRLGIDVSAKQCRDDDDNPLPINWNRVKAEGINFAIIRVGYRGYGTGICRLDDHFTENYYGAVAAGVKVGVYFFSEAINADEGKEEADQVLVAIKGMNITEPIAIDTENVGDGARADDLSRDTRTAVVKAFCDEIQAYGHTPMIYASKSWLNNNLDMSLLSSYKTWVAQYLYSATATTDYDKPYQYWQYTSSGTINGINPNAYNPHVDMNICVN